MTLPIFLVLCVGVWLRRSRRIDDAFVEKGSQLVFQLALPTVLFLSISQADFARAFNQTLIGVGLIGTLLVWGTLELLSSKLVHPPSDRGVVVQAGFRSNMGIIGLAYCFNAFGQTGLIAASMYLALVTILFNVLSVISLNRWSDQGVDSSVKAIVKGIATNPLIVAICAAIPFSAFQIPLPTILTRGAEYIAQLALPLALLCTGASLSFASLRASSVNSTIAVAAKLLIAPIAVTAMGVFAGLRDLELGIVLLMSSAPTAAASYVMVRSIGGNAALAANVVAITTVLGIVTTSGLYALAVGFNWV